MGNKVIDREKALLYVGGDEELMAEIVLTFLDSTPNQIESIQKAIDAQDLIIIEREAHSIKSASMAIGAERLSETAKKTEKAAKDGLELARQCFQNLLDEFDLLKQHFASEK